MSAHNDDDEDLGEPVIEIRELMQETCPTFLGRIRRKVQRRSAAAYLASFAFHAPKIVAVESLKMITEILSTLGRGKGG